MIAAVMVNGCFSPALSKLSSLPAGVVISHAPQGGLILSLPDHCEVTEPVKLIYRTDDNIAEVNMQHAITLGRNSKLTLVDDYNGDVEQTSYTVNMHITQKQDSAMSLVCLKNGAKSSHDTIHVVLAETGAECKTAGFYHVQRDNQHVNYHLTIEHAAAHTTSDMLFKGIAENKSRAVFVGRLHVHPHAQKITAHQANHNLLLTPNAEVSSKPELEIYADDVKCKHGATTGQLDQDTLFYLRSRGIAEEEAKRMLIEGFADEVLQRAIPRLDTMRENA
jgi:Fe-S cluster assembly protein SufD